MVKEYHTREALLNIIEKSKIELNKAREIALRNETLLRLNKNSSEENKRLRNAKCFLEKELKNHANKVIIDPEAERRIKELEYKLEMSENEKVRLETIIMDQKQYMRDNVTYGVEQAQIIRISDIFYEQSHKFMNDTYAEYSNIITQAQDWMKGCIDTVNYNNEICSARNINLMEKTIREVKRSALTEKELISTHREKYKNVNKDIKPTIKEMVDNCEETIVKNNSIAIKGYGFFTFNENKGLSLNKSYLNAVLADKAPDVEMGHKYYMLKNALNTKLFYLKIKGSKIEVKVPSNCLDVIGTPIWIWTHPSELTTAKWIKKKSLGEFRGEGTLTFDNALGANLFHDKMYNISKILTKND